jgi:hypothetical protein
MAYAFQRLIAEMSCGYSVDSRISFLQQFERIISGLPISAISQ